MAQKVEIDIPIFERNLKIYNKKSLRRSFSSVEAHCHEYLIVPPLSSTSQMVLEVTLDKENVEEFQGILKEMGFSILGSKNTYYLDKLLEDYEKNKKYFENEQARIDEITKEREETKALNKDYEEVENDNVKFYFLPKNEGVSTLYEFVKTKKDAILAYAKEKDITIMMRVCGFSKQIEGFLGFNFFDADQEGEVVVEYAARMTVAVDFNMLPAAYAAALLLAGIGESKEDLADPDLNVHLIAENIKYTKA